NRLSLVIGKALQPLGIETASESSAVRVLSLSPHKLKIVSESGEALGNVRITDAWGRIVLDNPAVSSSTYEYQTPTPGIYVVRIGAEVRKVVSIR
ncbi:MAG: T9SS type A sorting domain-containing protein, partial [Dysgonamonadaceae bacterium]|nr:T9SS type A sorting domain-containing protein [Dysgonamonadaceae bacterium]